MPKRSAADWIQEALSLAALAAIIFTITAHWTELPARAPTHFGASGAPNGWGGKSAMLLLPSTSVALYILMTIASRYQRLINVPMKIDRDASEVQRLLQSMSITLKAVLLFAFAYLEWAQGEYGPRTHLRPRNVVPARFAGRRVSSSQRLLGKAPEGSEITAFTKRRSRASHTNSRVLVASGPEGCKPA